MTDSVKTLGLILIVLLTAACGGSGGSGGSTDTATGPVLPPRTAQAIYFVENDPNTTNDYLYAQTDEGGALTRLTPDYTHANGFIDLVSLSPDGQTLAYTSNADTETVSDLYLIPVTGGTPMKISSGLPTATQARGHVSQLAWSPDGSSLAYVANPQGRTSRGFTINEVFMVNSDGTNNRKVSGSIGNPAVVSVDAVQWSPDGRYLAQRVTTLDPYASLGLNIYDTTLNAANSTRITPSSPPRAEKMTYQWSPDSQSIAYLAPDSSSLGQMYLYTVGPNGSRRATQVNPRMNPSGRVSQGFSWSADSQQILYHANQEVRDEHNIYLGNRNGGARRVNGSYAAGAPRGVGGAIWSPDKSHIAYSSSEDIAGAREAYVVSADGSSKSKLHDPRVDGETTFPMGWSPNGLRMLLVSNQLSGQRPLSVVNSDGSNETRVGLAPEQNEVLIFGVWSPDGQKIAYVTSPDAFSYRSFRLYVTSADGLSSSRLDTALPIDHTVISSSIRWSQDSSRITFLDGVISSSGLPDSRNLYAVTLDGAAPLKLNQGIVKQRRVVY